MARIAGWLAMMTLATAAVAQPVFNTKQVVICKRPMPQATAPGDVTKTSMVTMRFVDAPLRQVLSEFGRQVDAGVEIEATNDGYTQTPSLDWVETTRVSVSVKRANYWDALGALVKAVPVALDPQGRDGTLLLVEHPGGSAGGAISSREGVLAMAALSGARRVGALLLAPMVMSRNYEGKDERRFILAVAAEPRVSGFSGLAVLRLAELTSGAGGSLLGEKREFVSGEDGSWSSEYARWAFDVGDPPAAGVKVKAMRGDLRLGASSAQQQRSLQLTSMFQPTPPVPGEVQVNEECQIFRAPNFGEARGTYTSRDRSFPNECKVVQSHHGIPGLESGRLLASERGHSVYTEDRTLALHNITDSPETFVVQTTFPPDQVRYTSEAKPIKVQDHGELRVVVQPGATERLHIAYRVDQSRRRVEPTVDEVPLAPQNVWQTATVDETRLTVEAVVPEAGEYVVRGEFSSKADGPVAYACPRECQSLGVNDAEGRQILRLAAYGRVHREGDRDLMEWSLTTASRGLVPAKLTWGPGTTRWIRVSLR